jgi:hypothetical protein
MELLLPELGLLAAAAAFLWDFPWLLFWFFLMRLTFGFWMLSEATQYGEEEEEEEEEQDEDLFIYLFF